MENIQSNHEYINDLEEYMEESERYQIFIKDMADGEKIDKTVYICQVRIQAQKILDSIKKQENSIVYKDRDGKLITDIPKFNYDAEGDRITKIRKWTMK